MPTSNDFIASARLMLGVPFRHQGRDPRQGVDCIGLAQCAAKAIGFKYFDRTDYPRTPIGQLEPLMEEHLIKVPLESIQPGDILLMTFTREPMHIAIWTGVSIIHTYANLGKVVEHSLNDKWRRRILSAYRLKEFA